MIPISSSTDACMFFETSLGWIGLRGSERGLSSLTFGHASRDSARKGLGGISASPADQIPKWMHDAQRLLCDYADGELVDLSLIPLDLTARTPFEQRVRTKLSRIGYGVTISYGELAAIAGKPGAARAVGNIMARNPVPLVIPCHRVLAAGGRLGGYSAPAGLKMKRTLLELERQAILTGGSCRSATGQ